jgi:hypothetical protein
LRCTTRVSRDDFYAGIRRQARSVRQSLHGNKRRKAGGSGGGGGGGNDDTDADNTNNTSPREMLKVHISSKQVLAVQQKRLDRETYARSVAGFRRLAELFPLAPFTVLEQVVAASPHERAAVLRLLQLGYGLDLAVTKLAPGDGSASRGDGDSHGGLSPTMRNTRQPYDRDPVLGAAPHNSVTRNVLAAGDKYHLMPTTSAAELASPGGSKRSQTPHSRRSEAPVPRRQPPTEAEKLALMQQQERQFERQRQLEEETQQPVRRRRPQQPPRDIAMQAIAEGLDSNDADFAGIIIDRDERGRTQSTV